MKKKLMILLITLFCSLPVFSAEKLTIAIMDLRADGVKTKIATAVSNMVRNEFINSKLFTVIERTQLDKILREQGLQQTGVTDIDTAARLGKIMNAGKILVGEVSSIEKNIVLTIRIVDVERGFSDFSAKEEVNSKKNLSRGVADIVETLIERIQISKDIAKRTMSGYFLRGIVPGWGQFYSENNTKGYLFATAAVITAAFSTYALIDYKKKASDYDDLAAGTPQSEFDSKYDDKKKASTMAWIGIGSFAGVYLLNWVDLIFFSKPDYGHQNIKSISSRYMIFDVKNCYSRINGSEELYLNFGYGMKF